MAGMPKRSSLLLLGTILLLAGVIWGLRYWAGTRYRCADCNVILISIDTLRADHLGCYGYSRATSPAIDAFAGEAVRFETAIAQGPSTLVSHASMLTGVIPGVHGAFVMRKSPVRRSIPTLAELLKKRGMASASFNGGGQMSSRYGLDRGFDQYVSFSGNDYTQETFAARVREGVEWLERNKQRQFFLFLHSYEVHHPYTPGEKYAALFDAGYRGELPREITYPLLRKLNERFRRLSAADRRHVVNMYDAEVRSMDDAFAELLRYLRQSGLYDRTLIIFTSDHGEEFGEHGRIGYHAHTLFDELLRVPLVVRFPGGRSAGAVVRAQVRGVDIVPTILDVLDLDLPPHLQGQTLIDAVRGRSFDPYAYSQRDSRHRLLPTSVRTHEWKATRRRLYNLQRDPGEKADVSSQFPDVYSEFTAMIRAAIEFGEKVKTAPSLELEKETLEQLKTLGYF